MGALGRYSKALILFRLSFVMTKILFLNVWVAASKSFCRSFNTLLKNYCFCGDYDGA